MFNIRDDIADSIYDPVEKALFLGIDYVARPPPPPGPTPAPPPLVIHRTVQFFYTTDIPLPQRTVTRGVYKFTPISTSFEVGDRDFILDEIENAIKVVAIDGVSWGFGKWVKGEFAVYIDVTYSKETTVRIVQRIVEETGIRTIFLDQELSCEYLVRMIKENVDGISNAEFVYEWNEVPRPDVVPLLQRPRYSDLTLELKRIPDVQFSAIKDHVINTGLDVLWTGFSEIVEVVNVTGYFDSGRVTIIQIVDSLRTDLLLSEVRAPTWTNIVVELQKKFANVNYTHIRERAMRDIRGVTWTGAAIGRDVYGNEVLELTGFYDELEMKHRKIVTAATFPDLCYPPSATGWPIKRPE